MPVCSLANASLPNRFLRYRHRLAAAAARIFWPTSSSCALILLMLSGQCNNLLAVRTLVSPMVASCQKVDSGWCAQPLAGACSGGLQSPPPAESEGGEARFQDFMLQTAVFWHPTNQPYHEIPKPSPQSASS